MNLNTMYTLALTLIMVSCCVGKTLHGGYFRKLSSSNLKESYHQFMKKSNDTCFVQSPCTVSISKPGDASRCKIQRRKGVLLNRQFYRLTVLGEKHTIEFPLRYVPFLNQTVKAVAYHTALDPVDSKWFSTINAIFAAGNMIRSQQEQNKLPRIKNFNNISSFKAAYYLHNKLIKMLKAPQYYGNPAMEKTFTDIITNDRWSSDEVFVQQRLAGACPFTLRKVTVSGSVGIKWSVLQKQLNPRFNFDAAIQDALDLDNTLEEVVQKEMLYVLYFEGHNDMKTQPDLDAEGYKSFPRKMRNVTSPITLFVRTSSGDLKVVAIQWDYKPESQVYTPKSDALSWKLAKSMVDLAEFNQCQFIWHLSHLHLSFTVYCVIFRSHFSELHPIYQIMQYHCLGTTSHMALTFHTAALPITDKANAIGNKGILKLVRQGMDSYHYGLLAHDELLKRRGLDSDEIKYHPFRDDGKLLWNEFQRFASSFVNIYYKADGDVQHDSELQSFANEVSIDGKKAPYGGRGKIVDFPSSFKKKEEVTLFLTRFIWNIAIHASANYPLEPWVTFIPLSPTKLYYDSNLRSTNNTAYMFPRFGAAERMTVFLGNFRVNRIMDHYDKIHDKTLSRLVEHHYHRLHQCVQKTLEKRNALRKSNQQMGYQYFEPKWLTNSIHI